MSHTHTVRIHTRVHITQELSRLERHLAFVAVVRARDQAIEAANVDLRDLVTTLRQQIDLNKEMQNKMEAVIHQAVYRSVLAQE